MGHVNRMILIQIASGDNMYAAARAKARENTIRLGTASLVIACGFCLRSAVWLTSSITGIADGPYPWFYPFLFYQVPDWTTAISIACIVANVDVVVRSYFTKYMDCQKSSKEMNGMSDSIEQ